MLVMIVIVIVIMVRAMITMMVIIVIIVIIIVRERGSAPERGRHSTMSLFHAMHLRSGSLTVWQFPDKSGSQEPDS